MRVEVVHIDECPNWVAAGERVRGALDRVGLSDVPVEFVLVTTSEEAAESAFAGSPTILIDGVDVVPSGGQTTDLACRVYVTETGLAGLPSERQLEEGIRARLP